MASCGGSLAKFLLGVINVAFILTAFTFIMFGYRIRQMNHSTEEVMGVGSGLDWATLSTWVMAIGLVLMLISAFGFAATICESVCMLNMYSYFLVLCTVLVATAYGFAIAYTPELVTEGRNLFGRLVVNYTDNAQARRLVDKVQASLFCCGNLNKDDWHQVSTVECGQSSNSTNSGLCGPSAIPAGLYPNTCCGNKDVVVKSQPQSGATAATAASLALCPAKQLIYYDGCFSNVQISRVKYYAHSSFQVLLVSMMLLLAIACCLERDNQFRSSKRINGKYATHLETCRAPMPGTAVAALPLYYRSTSQVVYPE